MDENERRANRAHLEWLFDHQLSTLMGRGVKEPERIIRALHNRREKVLQEATRVWEEHYHGEGPGALEVRGVHLFVPVVPACIPYGEIDTLMGLVRYGREQGIVRIPLILFFLFSQWETTPEVPYYCVGVEDGRKMTLGMTPHDALGKIKEDDAHPLTIAESIAVAIHADVLERHYGMWLAGSFQRGGERTAVPFIALDGDKRPILSVSTEHMMSARLSTPFCRARV